MVPWPSWALQQLCAPSSGVISSGCFVLKDCRIHRFPCFPMFSVIVFPCFPVFFTCDWNNFDCQSTLIQSIYKFREDRQCRGDEWILFAGVMWVGGLNNPYLGLGRFVGCHVLHVHRHFLENTNALYIYIFLYSFVPHTAKLPGYQLMGFSILAKKQNFLRVASLSPTCPCSTLMLRVVYPCLPLVPLPPFWILFHHGCRC